MSYTKFDSQHIPFGSPWGKLGTTDSLFVYDDVDNRIGIGTDTFAGGLTVFSGDIVINKGTPPPPYMADATVVPGPPYLSGAYRLAISFIGPHGESDISPITSSRSTSFSTVQLTNIPTGEVGIVTGRRIYSYNASTLSLDLFAEIADNTTTTYTLPSASAISSNRASVAPSAQFSVHDRVLSIDTSNFIIGTPPSFNTGQNNLFIGSDTGIGATDGVHNTIVGHYNLKTGFGTDSARNTIVGYGALPRGMATDNVVIGCGNINDEQPNNQNLLNDSIIIGNNIRKYGSTGELSESIIIGNNSRPTDGKKLVMIGHGIGAYGVLDESVVVGWNAGGGKRAERSVAIGSNVLNAGAFNNISDSVVIGKDADAEINDNNIVAIGSTSYGFEKGVAVGNESQAGSSGVAVGYSAGTFDNGTGNISLGADSGVSAGLTNAMAIGYQASCYSSNTAIIGKANTSFGVGVASPAERVHFLFDEATATRFEIENSQNQSVIVKLTRNNESYGLANNSSGKFGIFNYQNSAYDLELSPSGNLNVTRGGAHLHIGDFSDAPYQLAQTNDSAMQGWEVVTHQTTNATAASVFTLTTSMNSITVVHVHAACRNASNSSDVAVFDFVGLFNNVSGTLQTPIELTKDSYKVNANIDVQLSTGAQYGYIQVVGDAATTYEWVVSIKCVERNI